MSLLKLDPAEAQRNRANEVTKQGGTVPPTAGTPATVVFVYHQI
jgi:hypothetical protein